MRICDAIDSVLGRTYSNIEAVVVDDGSTDKTLKVLEKYGNKINVISQTNKGCSAILFLSRLLKCSFTNG
jgi:glycosyltransferase involved in cell wall biosynthesis